MVYVFMAYKGITMMQRKTKTEYIWITDLPFTERILVLIYDIYLVRALRLYDLEEDLLAKIIFLFRSRELMIKYTRRVEALYDPKLFHTEQPLPSKRRRLLSF